MRSASAQKSATSALRMMLQLVVIETRSSIDAETPSEGVVRNVGPDDGCQKEMDMKKCVLCRSGFAHDENGRHIDDEGREIEPKLFDLSMMLDRPWRIPVTANDTELQLIFKMGEGDSGAMKVTGMLHKKGNEGMLALFALAEMNIRGSQLWVVYKDIYGENIDKMLTIALEDGERLSAVVNKLQHRHDSKFIAVPRGANK